jgi:hypothetical protein
MEEPEVWHTVPAPQFWTTQPPLTQVSYAVLVLAARQTIAPLLLAVHVAEPVGVAEAVVALVVVVVALVVAVVAAVVVVALVVVVVALVVVEVAPLRIC